MRRGFFFNEEIGLHRGYDSNCEDCGLYKNCRSPRMEVTGEGSLGILIIAEAPGQEEDESCLDVYYPLIKARKKGPVQLIGPAGQLFRRKLSAFGFDLDRDFWKTNAVNCRLPGNRNPTRRELRCCRPRLNEIIDKLKPKMIWLLGNSALESFLMDKGFSSIQIGTWRRYCIPDRDTGAWIVPLLHPSFALRNQGNPYIESVYDRDLRWAASLVDKGPPSFESYNDKVESIVDFNRLMEVFSQLRRNCSHEEIPFFFDYETTGIKPYFPGHKIVSISFCFDHSKAYSFPFQYSGVWEEDQLLEIRKQWKAFLLNPNLKKASHNMKFESSWSFNVFGVQPVNWVHDTMQAAHILDDRHGITGLDFQAYVRYGIYGWGRNLDGYKQGFPINRMGEAPLDELLFYNAIDSLVGFWLWEDQEKEFSLKSNESLRRAYELWHEGALCFCDMEQDGLCIDSSYYREMDVKLKDEIERLKRELNQDRWVQIFEKRFGKQINFGSTKDLSTLFFEVMKVEPRKKTEKGNFSVDSDVLEEIAGRVPLAQKLLRVRKLEKIRGTYLAQFIRESVGGKIHPIFNLHLARSYRSSSERPNFQNIPVRDEEAKRIIRSGIIPSPGNKIVEVDFKGNEVRMAANYSRDPELIRYLLDEKSDMHRDQASILFLMERDDVTDEIRYLGKNGWVFPQIYGSNYSACAKNLWKAAGETKLKDGKFFLRDWLADKGISTYTSFERHLRNVEQQFWERFKALRDWQERTINFYLKRGYVEMFFGHRRGGLLDRNQIINSPLQGTAFHCLLWVLIRLNKIRKEEKWKTKMPGQIHDSIFFDLYPPEEEHVLQIVRKLVIEEAKENFDWMVVPLDMEIESTEVNQAWYYKRKLK